jgi:hypothetical protein
MQGDWIDFSSTGWTSYAIDSSGQLWAWGDGPLGDGTLYGSMHPIRIPGGPWKSVSTCGPHTVAVTTDGDVYTWGGNSYGELGNGTARAPESWSPRLMLNSSIEYVRTGPGTEFNPSFNLNSPQIVKANQDDPGGGAILRVNREFFIERFTNISASGISFGELFSLPVLSVEGSPVIEPAELAPNVSLRVLRVEVVSGGQGYENGAAVVFSPNAAGIAATGRVVVYGGAVLYVLVDYREEPVLYDKMPTATIVGSGGGAVVQVVATGRMTGIDLRSKGRYQASGLSVAWKLLGRDHSTVVSQGDTSGAFLPFVVARITGIDVIDGGSGYTCPSGLPLKVHCSGVEVGECVLSPSGVASVTPSTVQAADRSLGELSPFSVGIYQSGASLTYKYPPKGAELRFTGSGLAVPLEISLSSAPFATSLDAEAVNYPDEKSKASVNKVFVVHSKGSFSIDVAGRNVREESKVEIWVPYEGEPNPEVPKAYLTFQDGYPEIELVVWFDYPQWSARLTESIYGVTSRPYVVVRQSEEQYGPGTRPSTVLPLPVAAVDPTGFPSAIPHAPYNRPLNPSRGGLLLWGQRAYDQRPLTGGQCFWLGPGITVSDYATSEGDRCYEVVDNVYGGDVLGLVRGVPATLTGAEARTHHQTSRLLTGYGVTVYTYLGGQRYSWPDFQTQSVYPERRSVISNLGESWEGPPTLPPQVTAVYDDAGTYGDRVSIACSVGTQGRSVGLSFSISDPGSGYREEPSVVFTTLALSPTRISSISGVDKAVAVYGRTTLLKDGVLYWCGAEHIGYSNGTVASLISTTPTRQGYSLRVYSNGLLGGMPWNLIDYWAPNPPDETYILNMLTQAFLPQARTSGCDATPRQGDGHSDSYVSPGPVDVGPPSPLTGVPIFWPPEGYVPPPPPTGWQPPPPPLGDPPPGSIVVPRGVYAGSSQIFDVPNKNDRVVVPVDYSDRESIFGVKKSSYPVAETLFGSHFSVPDLPAGFYGVLDSPGYVRDIIQTSPWGFHAIGQDGGKWIVGSGPGPGRFWPVQRKTIFAPEGAVSVSRTWSLEDKQAKLQLIVNNEVCREQQIQWKALKAEENNEDVQFSWRDFGDVVADSPQELALLFPAYPAGFRPGGLVKLRISGGSKVTIWPASSGTPSVATYDYESCPNKYFEWKRFYRDGENKNPVGAGGVTLLPLAIPTAEIPEGGVILRAVAGRIPGEYYEPTCEGEDTGPGSTFWEGPTATTIGHFYTPKSHTWSTSFWWEHHDAPIYEIPTEVDLPSINYLGAYAGGLYLTQPLAIGQMGYLGQIGYVNGDGIYVSQPWTSPALPKDVVLSSLIETKTYVTQLPTVVLVSPSGATVTGQWVARPTSGSGIAPYKISNVVDAAGKSLSTQVQNGSTSLAVTSQGSTVLLGSGQEVPSAYQRSFQKLGRSFGLSGGSIYTTESIRPRATQNVAVQVVNPGYGYTDVPEVRASHQPDSSIARVTPQFSGSVVSVGVIKGGSGFQFPPRVAFANGFASAEAVIEGPIGRVVVVNRGAGYLSPPLVYFDGPGIPAKAVAVLGPGGSVQSVTIIDGGRYRQPPVVQLIPTNFWGEGAIGAAAEAHIDGRVLYATVSSGGQYDSPPLVFAVRQIPLTETSFTDDDQDYRDYRNGLITLQEYHARPGVCVLEARVEGTVTDIDVNSGGNWYSDWYWNDTAKVENSPTTEGLAIHPLVCDDPYKSSLLPLGTLSANFPYPGGPVSKGNIYSGRVYRRRPEFPLVNSQTFFVEMVNCARNRARGLRSQVPVSPWQWVNGSIHVKDISGKSLKTAVSHTEITLPGGSKAKLSDIPMTQRWYKLLDVLGTGAEISESGRILSISAQGGGYTDAVCLQLVSARPPAYGAYATTEVDSSGSVSGVSLDSGGFGYLNPVAFVYGGRRMPGVPYRQAKLGIVMAGGSMPRSIAGVVVLDGGSGYDPRDPPSVQITEGTENIVDTELGEAINKALRAIPFSSLMDWTSAVAEYARAPGDAPPGYVGELSSAFRSCESATSFSERLQVATLGDLKIDTFAFFESIHSVNTLTGRPYNFASYSSPPSLSVIGGCYTPAVVSATLASWSAVEMVDDYAPSGWYNPWNESYFVAKRVS